MIPMRISATTLESFRLFQYGDFEGFDGGLVEIVSETELIATILGQFSPNQDVLRGIAWGKVLEKPDKYRVNGGYAYRDEHGNVWNFSTETMARPMALLDYQHGIFEAKAEKVYADAIVVSKADYLLGLHMREFKSTAAAFDADKYANSYQWRLMVDAFQPEVVTYDVFVLDDHENGVVDLKDLHSMNLYPYPDVHLDCARLVAEFRHFVIKRGLDGVLRDRQRKAAKFAGDIFASA